MFPSDVSSGEKLGSSNTHIDAAREMNERLTGGGRNIGVFNNILVKP
jgi:hypothetical protein